MTKRFSKYVPDSYNYTSVITIVDHETNKRSGSIDDFVELLNALNDENEKLKHRLAISEKANFVTALEKENVRLKQQLIEKERMLDVRDKIIADVIKAVNGD